MGRRWLVLGVIGLAGCGDAAGEATDTPDGGDDGAAFTDAASETGDGGVTFPGDAAADGDASSTAGPFATVFADDFGDGDLKDDWDVLNVCTGCSAAIENGAFVAKTKAVVSQETAFAHLRTTVAGTPARVRLSFFATLPSVTLTKGSVAIATVDVSTSHFFSLYLRDADVNDPAPVLEETSTAGTVRHFLANLPPAGTKTRVVIDIDLAGGLANVSWDATRALADEPIAKTPGATDPTIRVGLMYVFGPEDAFEGTFDDVLLEYASP